MSEEIANYTIISLILIGDSLVGKTSLMKRYVDNEFFDDTLSTIGIEVVTKKKKINNKLYHIKIWDTCGQERLRSLTLNYYKNADGIILVYDVNSEESFSNLDYWMKSIDSRCKKEIPVLIIGNKIDKKDLIDKDSLNDFVEKHNNIPMYKTSAKSGINVNEAFDKICTMIIDSDEEKEEMISLESHKQKSSCC
jgi:small GTP-binding protein